MESYLLLYTNLAKNETKPLIKVAQFDPANPSTFRLGPGKYSFFAEISDVWGAKVTV